MRPTAQKGRTQPCQPRLAPTPVPLGEYQPHRTPPLRRLVLTERSSHPVYSSSQLSHLSILLLGSPSQRDHAGDELLDDLIDTIDAVVRTGTASSADVLGRLLTPSHRSRSCGGSSPFARLHNAAGAGAIRPLPGPTEIVSRVRRRWRVATETSSHCVRWCGRSL